MSHLADRSFSITPFREKSYTNCRKFGMHHAGIDKLLCRLQFVILNLTDWRPWDGSDPTGLLLSLELSWKEMCAMQINIISETLLGDKNNLEISTVGHRWISHDEVMGGRRGHGHGGGGESKGETMFYVLTMLASAGRTAVWATETDGLRRSQLGRRLSVHRGHPL